MKFINIVRRNDSLHGDSIVLMIGHIQYKFTPVIAKCRMSSTDSKNHLLQLIHIVVFSTNVDWKNFRSSKKQKQLRSYSIPSGDKKDIGNPLK